MDKTQDFFLDDSNVVSRLVEEYQRYGMLIVAYDFDNTVFDYYQKGYSFDCVIELLRECKTLGFHLTLFTSCNDDRMPEIKEYLKKNNIPYDSINDTPDFIPFKGRKIYYNHFLDDRAGLSSAYNVLKEVVFQVKNLKRQQSVQKKQDVDF